MAESVDDPPVTLGHSKWIVPRTTRVYAPGREVDARHSMLAALDFTLSYYPFARDRPRSDPYRSFANDRFAQLEAGSPAAHEFPRLTSKRSNRQLPDGHLTEAHPDVLQPLRCHCRSVFRRHTKAIDLLVRSLMFCTSHPWRRA